MGSQSQVQAAQHEHGRPISNHAQSSNGAGDWNALMGGGGGSISRVQSLARQGSIYSITLDDLQRSLMEPGGSGQAFGSMNMDEFLKNIWTMEESQAMASAMLIGGGEADGPGSGEPGAGHMASENGLVRQPSLARHGSLPIPRQISRKTVDEAWRDIIKTNPNLAPEGAADVGTGSGPGMNGSDSQRQTYGEMTLEAFLVKAGVVKDGGVSAQPSTPYSLFEPYAGSNGAGGLSDRGNDKGERMGPGSLAATLSLSPANGPGSANDGMAQQHAQAQQQVQGQVDWLQNIQQQQAQHHAQQQQLFQAQADAYAMKARAANEGMQPMMSSNGGYTGMASALAPGLGQMGIQLGGPMALALAPNSPGAHIPVSDVVGNSQGNGLSLSSVGNFGVDGSMRGRRKGADGRVEKVVERRQRRMIKNRDSAARSRARKQAYTVELEAEVIQLKEDNNRLKSQLEGEAQKYKKLFLETIKAKKKSKPVLRRLRRTSSSR